MEKTKRPRITEGLVIKVQTGCGSAYVIPSYIDGRLLECFMHLGKAGGCAIAQGEALLRSISIGLRYNVPIEEYIEQLRGIACPNQAWDNGAHVMSCPDAIAKVLTEFKVKPSSTPVTEVKSEEEVAAEETQRLAEERERQGLNE